MRSICLFFFKIVFASGTHTVTTVNTVNFSLIKILILKSSESGFSDSPNDEKVHQIMRKTDKTRVPREL